MGMRSGQESQRMHEKGTPRGRVGEEEGRVQRARRWEEGRVGVGGVVRVRVWNEQLAW